MRNPRPESAAKTHKQLVNRGDFDMSGCDQPWVEGLTIGQVLRETARRNPENDAFVFVESGERATWKEFDQDTDRLAKSLLSVGLKPGDRVGVWSTNIPGWVRLQFATARIGVVLVTINPAYRAKELDYTLRQAELNGLALVDSHKSSDYVATLLEVCPEVSRYTPNQLDRKGVPEFAARHLAGRRQPANRHDFLGGTSFPC